MTIALKFWREILIAALIAGLVLAWNVVDDRNATITAQQIELAEFKAVAATDNKWTAATTKVLTELIGAQNDGIDRVLSGISQASADITGKVDQTRAENAKKDASLRNFISNLPTATDCSIMMDNMIRSGEAVQW